MWRFMSRQMPGVACFQLPAFCGIKKLKSANLTFIGLSAAFCHFSIGHPLGVTAHVAQSREVRPSCTRQVFEVAFWGIDWSVEREYFWHLEHHVQEKEKGIRYKSFSEQVVKSVEQEALKKKHASEFLVCIRAMDTVYSRDVIFCGLSPDAELVISRDMRAESPSLGTLAAREKEEQRAKVVACGNKSDLAQLPYQPTTGGLYWQPNIHYIPASIKFGDNGEVIVTGGPPENAKANGGVFASFELKLNRSDTLAQTFLN
ncbi:hypothetical protein AK812_SmicGene30002 [Symbiodinium microadriaticum]|uniref:Uncharacterized protein n=1 Tax=Symbiodinium microadriaticum TaxID=2951 RepID=A0A1Q9D0E3_SYMMI|nr:hypothetical protein AK812_SmicGene30002 [Symbiodinium microadriaticum]